MFEVDQISIRVGNFCLKEISFSVKENHCHVIMGTSGSGKTLLLETIVGLRDPVKGQIRINNKDLVKIPPEKRNMSYLPQDLALFPHLTVKNNINYSLRIRGHNNYESHSSWKNLIKSIGIEHLLDRHIKYLSGGEKQRIALARAMVSGSKLLILDEPFSSLNGDLKRDLWKVLKVLQREHSLTVLLVTHDEDEAKFLADSGSSINEGVLERHKFFV